MHIPNGFLSDPVCAATTAASTAAYGKGLWRARQTLDRRQCESLAVASAAIFATQMINFPIDHGTSGHLIGAGAVAILLGPYTAMLAMGVVLAAQATLFGDGAIATWGANMLSMGIAAPWTAWAVSRVASRLNQSPRVGIALSGVAGFASVIAAVSVCSFELVAAGKTTLGEVLPAMLGAHLFVGLSEGLLTAVVVAVATAQLARPAVLNTTNRPVGRKWFAASAAVALLLAPWASSAPDGLESVAARLGFSESAAGLMAAIAPDYVLPGVGWMPLATGLAGLVGVVAVVAASYAVGRLATCRAAKR